MHHCSSCLPYLAVLYLNGQDFFFPVLKLNWTKIYFYPSWWFSFGTPKLLCCVQTFLMGRENPVRVLSCAALTQASAADVSNSYTPVVCSDKPLQQHCLCDKVVRNAASIDQRGPWSGEFPSDKETHTHSSTWLHSASRHQSAKTQLILIAHQASRWRTRCSYNAVILALSKWLF